MAMMPRFIDGLTRKGVIVRDYYKYKSTFVPTEGGIIILFACALMITLFPLLIYLTRIAFSVLDVEWVSEPHLSEINVSVVLVLITYGLFGMMDDYLDISRPAKAVLPAIFTIPLILSINPDVLYLPMGGRIDLEVAVVGIVTWGALFRFVFIPVYILVTSNLVNMHSGFNGLATGTSSIVLGTLLIKAHFKSGTTNDLISLGAVLGALLALWWYNRYPARIFEGNTGALMIGAAIGLVICLKGFFISGFIMLLPHTINFLMYVFWRIRRLQYPDSKRYRTVKFGSVRKDGTLDVPNRLTLKWFFPHNHRMDEKRAVLLMYLLTVICCAVGLFVSGEGMWPTPIMTAGF